MKQIPIWTKQIQFEWNKYLFTETKSNLNESKNNLNETNGLVSIKNNGSLQLQWKIFGYFFPSSSNSDKIIINKIRPKVITLKKIISYALFIFCYLKKKTQKI